MGRISKLNIGSLNCRGLNEFYKRSSLFQELKDSELDVVFLQETKLKPELARQYEREWGGEAIFNSTFGSKSGTAILISNPGIKLFHGTKMIDVEGRVIAIDMEFYGSRIHLVNSYGPNDSNLRIPFLNRMYLYMYSNVQVIWGGDHNLTVNPKIDRFPPKLNNDVGGKDFIDILNCFDLKDCCRVLFPTKPMFTFHREITESQRELSKSRIDKICVSNVFSVRDYVHENTVFSDHNLIKTCITFDAAYERGPGVWKNNVKYYKEESFLDDFREFWEEHIQNETSSS